MDNCSQPSSGSSAADASAGAEPDLTGQTLDDFHILRRLGQGGMGQVYLAQQLSLKRKVALKIMRADLAANATALKRFKAEAEAVARITHANIVQVYAIGESSGRHYMALEYVDGRNLREFLTRKGPPEPLLALSIMRQGAAALQRASELGIVHRDIKPENILLTRKGEVKIADFGLSRCFAGDQQPLNLTQSGVTMGTPLYMSPEQVQGKEIDPRADIYSFGVTCYHMLAGEPPFRGGTAFEVAMMHVQKQPVPLSEVRPDLPPELPLIVHKMMAKEPADRYQTGRELLKDLTRLREGLNGEQAGQRSSGVRVSLPESAIQLAAGSGSQLPMTTALPGTSPRRWLPWVAALTVLLALVGGAAFRVIQRRSAHSLPTDSGSVAQWAVDPDGALEQRLREQVQAPFNPDDPRQAAEALTTRVQLGLFYLQRRRLDEAEPFFNGLKQSKVDGFSILGTLGMAMTLAFRDQAEASNKEFQTVLKGYPLVRNPLHDEGYRLRDYPELWEMIDQALERNQRNGQPVPENLKRYHWVPGKRPGPLDARPADGGPELNEGKR